MTFSARHGYTEVRTSIQHEGMDKALRTDLWNVTLTVFEEVTNNLTYCSDSYLCSSIWQGLWRQNADEIPNYPGGLQRPLKKTVLQDEWFRVYDLVEHIVQVLEDTEYEDEVVEVYNRTLKQNLAGYRLIDRKIVPIDSEVDLAAIEDALTAAGPLSGARHHLAQALALLSDRKSPDYANSMKESISAVESACNTITGKKTLGDALKHFKTEGMSIHPALESAWSKIYGYTSDANGIRHFAADEPTVDQAQAKYFLISCSAFVSLLLAEATKAGISIAKT